MDFDVVVKDFAIRTRKNLRIIEKNVENGQGGFEATQLINSLLGLLVFPEQYYFHRVKRISMRDLYEAGWPQAIVLGEHRDLRDLVRHTRNAVAHFNIEFLSDQQQELKAVKFWDTDPSNGNYWELTLNLKDLRTFVNKFVDMMIDEF